MRLNLTFNTDWKFHLGDAPDAQKSEFNDSRWRVLTLPHDWSIESPFDSQWASATGYLPGGIGWYRKSFTAPRTDEAQRVFIHFDGVYCNSEVWINGHYLGKRPNGFISFRYDLTPHLAADGNNLLAVKVDHSQFADCRWYTGSGINRNVSLIVTDAVHLKQWGVFATTPVVSEQEAHVEATIALQNHRAVATDVEVENLLLDAQGRVVAQARVAVSLAPGEESMICSLLRVGQPQLWSVEQPTLYVLRTLIHQHGRVIDAEQTRIGLRSIRFDADEGFFLNGHNLKLKGVCLHDDAGTLGTAVPPRVWERRLRILKEAGTNAIRMSHNPHMPELYDLCDEMGFLVQEEAFDEWELGKNKWIEGWNVGTPGKDGYNSHFAAWSETDLRDMILRGRNHPSIIMWSLGNEIDYPNDPYSHEILDTGTNPQIYGRGFQPSLPHANRLGEIAQRLAAVARDCDPTRPLTAALAAASMSNETGFPNALDVVGYNYQEYRYPEDHARYPGRVLYGSENGMGTKQWRAVEENPFIAAQFLWTGIDYLGEAHGWPLRSHTSGLLDMAGLKKPAFYLRQSLWTAQPMIYIATCAVPNEGEDAWKLNNLEATWANAEGTPVRIVCFSNCEQAELLLNGESLGIKDGPGAGGQELFWDVPFAPGTLTARGLKDGETTATWQLQTCGAPRKIIVTTDTETLQADGVDLAHITVTLVDENDVPVWTGADEVNWTLEGPARLLGVESGDPASHEGCQSPSRRAFHGQMVGYVQSTTESGAVQISLSSSDLERAHLTLHTKLIMLLSGVPDLPQ